MFSLRPGITVQWNYGFFPLKKKPGQNPGQKTGQTSGQKSGCRQGKKKGKRCLRSCSRKFARQIDRKLYENNLNTFNKPPRTPSTKPEIANKPASPFQSQA